MIHAAPPRTPLAHHLVPKTDAATSGVPLPQFTRQHARLQLVYIHRANRHSLLELAATGNVKHITLIQWTEATSPSMPAITTRICAPGKLPRAKNKQVSNHFRVNYRAHLQAFHHIITIAASRSSYPCPYSQFSTIAAADQCTTARSTLG